MNRPFTHCTKCGSPLTKESWPNRCEVCGAMHFLNPLPVAVLIQPTEEGVVTVRRGIEPKRGALAFPGGFIDVGESWQNAAVRELYEETQICVDPADVTLFDVVSAPDGTVLIFGIAPEIHAAKLEAFQPSKEVSELVVIGDQRELAFEIHTQMLEKWRRQRLQSSELNQEVPS